MSKKRDYGSGSIDPSGTNSWRLRYRIGGKRHAAVFIGTKTEARQELQRLLQAGATGQHVTPAKLTLKEWITQWIAAGAPNGRKRKKTARTIERYDELMQCHVVPTLGDTQLQKLGSVDIDNLYTKLTGTMAEKTLHHVHTVLGANLRQAVRKKLITASPMASADVPEVGESDHGMVLDETQLAKLVKSFKGSPLYPIIATAAFTGARLREILALQWSDLSFEKKTLTISRAIEEIKKQKRGTKMPKTERGIRTIELDGGLIELLTAHREKHLRLVAGIPDGAAVDLSLIKLPDGALMFPGGDGINLTKLRDGRAVSRRFKARARKLGFPKLRFHDLRGSHETALLDKGVPVHVVADRCGHDPAVLLRIYAKRTKKADSAAADVISTLSAGILGQ